MLRRMAIEPANRTPQEWVDFYLQIENNVASGKDMALNGRRISFEDLGEIRKARAEWERRAALKASRSTPMVGGMRYKTAAMN